MTTSKQKRNELARRVSAATKAAGSHYVPIKVTAEEYAARLAEIPPDSRSLTARICGDPIPGDARRNWRAA